jgi:hypothetical protein
MHVHTTAHHAALGSEEQSSRRPLSLGRGGAKPVDELGQLAHELLVEKVQRRTVDAENG